MTDTRVRPAAARDTSVKHISENVNLREWRRVHGFTHWVCFWEGASWHKASFRDSMGLRASTDFEGELRAALLERGWELRLWACSRPEHRDTQRPAEAVALVRPRAVVEDL